MLAYAPRETRTPTAHTGHKALNLARLPIPPQARDAADYRSAPGLPRGALDCRPDPRLVYEHTFGDPHRRPQAVDLKVTKRQQEIVEFIKRYSARHGYPPTVRDIGKAIGLTSPSTVHAHLTNLEKVGLLRRDPSRPRALELLVDTAKKAVRPSGLPVVGEVAAGAPVLAEENIEEYVNVPEIAGGKDGEFVLRVHGDSMKEAAILDG